MCLKQDTGGGSLSYLKDACFFAQAPGLLKLSCIVFRKATCSSNNHEGETGNLLEKALGIHNSDNLQILQANSWEMEECKQDGSSLLPILISKCAYLETPARV